MHTYIRTHTEIFKLFSKHKKVELQKSLASKKVGSQKKNLTFTCQTKQALFVTMCSRLSLCLSIEKELCEATKSIEDDSVLSQEED